MIIIMAKETEREEIKEETHELEDEEQDELEEEDLNNEEEWNLILKMIRKCRTSSNLWMHW